MFSKKATKIDKIFTGDLTFCSKCQTYGDDFVNFCGVLRKQELYNRYLFFSHHIEIKMVVDPSLKNRYIKIAH